MVSVTGEDTPTTVQGGTGQINPLLPNAFILGGGGDISMEELKRRRAIALALASRSKGYPKTLGEGLTSFGQDIGDVLAERRLTAQEQAYNAAAAKDPRFVPPGAAPPAGARSDADPRDRIAAIYAGGPGGAAGNPTVAAGASSPQASTPEVGGQADDAALWSARADAIGGIETGGTRDPYRTVGVPTKYGPALGRYGVVAANVPAWTQEALGQPMTPQQFLADPKAQDAVFQHRFGDYVNRFGEEGAARAWYGGAGQNNLNATDAFGRLTVKGYGQDYLNRLQGQRRGAPTSALTTGTVSDAPPVTGLPVGDENPPTPTDIQPMPTMVAEAGTGATVARGPVAIGPNQVPMPAVPGATAAPVSSVAPIPSVFDKPAASADAPPVKTEPNLPGTREALDRTPMPTRFNEPLTEEELRGMSIQRDPRYQGDERAQSFAQQLIAYGKTRRDEAYARRVEEWKVDTSLREKRILAEEQYKRELPKQIEERQRAADEDAYKKQMRDWYPDGVDKAYERAGKQAEKVAALPAAQQAITAIRGVINSNAGMFTGGAAGLDLNLAKIASAFGVPADPRMSNTEVFRGLVPPLLAALRPAIVGTGAQSLPEFNLLQDAAAGKITLEQGSILRIIAAVEKLNQYAAVNHQKALMANAGPAPAVQRGIFGNYELPMENFVPPTKVQMLKNLVEKAGDDPAKVQALKDEFDKDYYTPGLSTKLLGR